MATINLETVTAELDLDAVHTELQSIDGMKHSRPDGLLAVNYQIQFDDTNISIFFPDEIDPALVEAVLTSPGVRIAP